MRENLYGERRRRALTEHKAMCDKQLKADMHLDFETCFSWTYVCSAGHRVELTQPRDYGDYLLAESGKKREPNAYDVTTSWWPVPIAP